MSPAAANTTQILGRAFIVAALLVLAPTLFVVALWYIAPATRDPDVGGVFELIVTLVMITGIQAVPLSFGVMAPSAIVVDRLGGAQRSRMANLLLGVLVGIGGMVVFLVASSLLSPHRNLSLWQVLLRPLMLVKRSPDIAVALLAFFSLLGFVFGTGMRTRQPDTSES
jgi:hypothetical protein